MNNDELKLVQGLEQRIAETHHSAVLVGVPMKDLKALVDALRWSDVLIAELSESFPDRIEFLNAYKKRIEDVLNLQLNERINKIRENWEQDIRDDGDADEDEDEDDPPSATVYH